MLKKIKAHNFLSLKNVDLELGARNVLVGPNMSGKSNLIESLKFLQDAVSRPQDNTPALQHAFSKRGGFGEVLWKGAAEGSIILEAVAELTDPKTRELRSYDYEVSFRLGEYLAQEIQAERLTLGVAGAPKAILESGEGKSKLVVAGESTESVQNRIGLDLEGLARRPGFEGTTFWNFVANWRFYHLVPELMRRSNPPAWENYLLEHGDNLSTWLLTLQNHPEEFQRIKQACRDVLSGLAEILFQPVEAPSRPVVSGTEAIRIPFESAKISIGVSETHLRTSIGIGRMSDGELAFLALMSLILAPRELTPSVLCIEEPENYLHPRLLEILVEILDQRQAEDHALQVIATTHSPLLVDKLSIDDLIVADKVHGETKFTRASSKKGLKKLLSSKEASLGDLWYSGALTDS